MDVIILCGGKGTRSYPFTEYFPKPMMPVCGTPIVVHIMKLYASQGFSSFILAAGHRMEVLVDYFDGRFPEWNVRVVDTGAESDTGERIRRCQELLSGTFFATYGDGVGDLDLHRLLKQHRHRGGLVTMTSVPLRSQYGTVECDSGERVLEFREKPVLREHWINAGFFVMEKTVFDTWQGQNLENEVLPNLVKRGEVFVYRHDGFWKSMDTTKDQMELERAYQTGEIAWDPPVAQPQPQPIPRARDTRRSNAHGGLVS